MNLYQSKSQVHRYCKASKTSPFSLQNVVTLTCNTASSGELGHVMILLSKAFIFELLCAKNGQCSFVNLAYVHRNYQHFVLTSTQDMPIQTNIYVSLNTK